MGSAVCWEKYDEKAAKNRFFLARNVSGFFKLSGETIWRRCSFSYLKDKADSGESFVVVGRLCGDGFFKGNMTDLITIFVLGDEENTGEEN